MERVRETGKKKVRARANRRGGDRRGAANKELREESSEIAESERGDDGAAAKPRKFLLSTGICEPTPRK